MNRVVEILMKRDGISEDEASALVRETRDELIMLDNPFEADEIIENYLGLEPDYLEDLLFS